MKNFITENILNTLINLDYPSDKLNVQKTKNSDHGDYSTNIAMILSKQLNKKPLDIANQIIDDIKKTSSENFSDIQVAGPGFINFTVSKQILFERLQNIIDQNAELNFSSVFFSPEIYLPIVGFFVLLISAFFIKKFYFKS